MQKLKLEELNRLTAIEYKESDKIPIVVILDNVRSALNVGSVFRSSDAFAIEKIILTGITAQPPHREISKTAIGATKTVQWEYYEEAKVAVVQLKEKGYRIIGIEQTDKSTSLTNFKLNNQPIAIVMGNEVDGISVDILSLLDQAIEIDQFGTKHSLNVSVCTGIVLWQLSKLLREFN